MHSCPVTVSLNNGWYLLELPKLLTTGESTSLNHVTAMHYFCLSCSNLMHNLAFGNMMPIAMQRTLFKKSAIFCYQMKFQSGANFFFKRTFGELWLSPTPLHAPAAYSSLTWRLSCNIKNTSGPDPWIHHSTFRSSGIDTVIFIALFTHCVHADETRVTAHKKVTWHVTGTFTLCEVVNLRAKSWLSVAKYFSYTFHKISRDPKQNQSFASQWLCSELQWNCAARGPVVLTGTDSWHILQHKTKNMR